MSVFDSRRLSLLIAVVFALSLAVVACAPEEAVDDDPIDEPVEEEPQRGGRLVIGYAEEPNTLDAHLTAAASAYFVMSQISDPMVDRDPETADFIPALAEDWDISDDGLEITLYLRDDAEFHSGEPFTAEALKATWDRALDPETGTVHTDGVLGPMKELTAVDDYTLLIEMERPFGPLLHGFTMAGYTHAIDPVALEEHGEDYGRNPSSTGPYRFDDWVSGEYITLVRNEDYSWPPEYYENKGAPYPDEVEIRYITEDAPRLAALEAGELDIARVPPAEVDMFMDHPDFEIYSYMTEGVTMSVWFNQDREPLDDVLVRRALNLAIEKDPIIAAAEEGHAIEAHGPLPPNMWGYWEGVEDISYQYDPEEAGKLLDEAGWVLPEDEEYREKDGETLKLSLYIQPTDAWIATSEMLQAQYRDIGVKVEIESFEWGTLMEYLSEGRHDMNLMGYGYGDPDWLYHIFHSGEAGVGVNWAFIQDPEMDELVEAQRYTVDPDERMEYAAQAQELAVDQAYWAPIYIRKNYIAVHERVQDFDINYRGTWLLHDVWLSD